MQAAAGSDAAVVLQFRLYRGGSGMPLERVPLSPCELDKVRRRCLAAAAAGIRCCALASLGW